MVTLAKTLPTSQIPQHHPANSKCIPAPPLHGLELSARLLGWRFLQKLKGAPAIVRYRNEWTPTTEFELGTRCWIVKGKGCEWRKLRLVEPLQLKSWRFQNALYNWYKVTQPKFKWERVVRYISQRRLRISDSWLAYRAHLHILYPFTSCCYYPKRHTPTLIYTIHWSLYQ